MIHGEKKRGEMLDQHLSLSLSLSRSYAFIKDHHLSFLPPSRSRSDHVTSLSKRSKMKKKMIQHDEDYENLQVILL